MAGMTASNGGKNEDMLKGGEKLRSVSPTPSLSNSSMHRGFAADLICFAGGGDENSGDGV
jgi:hypothetical protein